MHAPACHFTPQPVAEHPGGDLAKKRSLLAVAATLAGGGGVGCVAVSRLAVIVVDGQYQGLGIASHLLRLLIKYAKDRGIQGFTADILASNKAMMNVFEIL